MKPEGVAGGIVLASIPLTAIAMTWLSPETRETVFMWFDWFAYTLLLPICAVLIFFIWGYIIATAPKRDTCVKVPEHKDSLTAQYEKDCI